MLIVLYIMVIMVAEERVILQIGGQNTLMIMRMALSVRFLKMKNL